MPSSASIGRAKRSRFMSFSDVVGKSTMKLDQLSFGEVRSGGMIPLKIDVTKFAQKGHF